MLNNNDITRHDVFLDSFHIETVEDLYNTILVPDGFDDYDGRRIYTRSTVWAVINDFDTFVRCLGMLSVDEITNWRDEMNGNILSSLARSNKPREYWSLISSMIGMNAFASLLVMSNRAGIPPIAEITDFELFRELLNMSLIDAHTLRQITIYGTQDIVSYLADVINRFEPDDDTI